MRGIVDFALNGLSAIKENYPVQDKDTQQIRNALPACIARQESAGVKVLYVSYRQKNNRLCGNTDGR
uniref:Uncharacterized protein n=1 Tax=Caudovirales sp. ctkvU4 TaxID=2826783 RepID=A0A8S5QRI8_9CAUD|nr:MAG TPA: hypothetical protein [Caudovirales sp. ctkvU4]